MNGEHQQALARLDRFRQALADAPTIDEKVDLLSQAEAIQRYISHRLRMTEEGYQALVAAWRCVVDAQWEIGHSIRPHLQHGGSRYRTDTLKQWGLSKLQSSRWQQLADEAPDNLDAYESWCRTLVAPKDRQVNPSLAGYYQFIARRDKPESAETPPTPDGRYRCIVLDPPWPMEKIERTERAHQGDTLDYPIMSLEEIADLPMPDLVDPSGCHVYLWVTHRFLPDGLDLFEHWGVRYQCVMTWVKPTGITPYSWMYNTEHVLFGRIGSLRLERMGLKLAFEAPVVRHSQKPDVFYDLVREASPEPRLELFARTTREGFVVWGNEVVADAS